MTQLPLLGERGLEPAQQQVAKQVTEQRRQLARCTATLREVIVAFCRERLAGQPTFHLAELVAAAQRKRGRTSNASSVDRVLRVLRQEGHLNYRVLDRGASLYELLPADQSKETPHDP